MKQVLVIATGTANLASVMAGLRRAGADPVVGADPEEVLRAPRVLLPGVGTFEAAMQNLAARELGAPLTERIRSARPTLAICLGLQVLFQGSGEGGESAGLGLFEGRAERFPESVPSPQLGWNRVVAEPGSRLLRTGHFYFANSYRLVEADGPAAWSDYGGRFVAALERGPLLACQFHPELSGRAGAELIGRWLQC